MGIVRKLSPFRDPSTRIGEVAAAIAAVFVLLAAYLVVSSGAASDAALRLTDGSVWLRSSQAGITLHDSGNGAVITALQTATGDDDFDVVQWQADALIVNSTTSTIARVDGTNWEIAGALPVPGNDEIRVFVGPAAAWRTSLGRIAEINPTDLSAATVEVPFSSRVHDGVVDSAGNLFLSTEGDGIQRFDRGATEAEAVTGEDGVADMFQVGGVAAAVNQNSRSIWMDGRGLVCQNLEVPADTPLHAEGSDELAVVVADSGFIHIFDPTEGCPTDPMSVNSGSFGDPVLADGWGVVPEFERSIVYLIDLDDRTVSPTEVQLELDPGTEFELISENGTVWFNDPASPTAGLIREDGSVTPISKYDPGNIDASFTVPEINEDAVDELLIQSLQLESAASAADADVSSLAAAEDNEETTPSTTTPEEEAAAQEEDTSTDQSFAADTSTPDSNNAEEDTTDEPDPAPEDPDPTPDSAPDDSTPDTTDPEDTTPNGEPEDETPQDEDPPTLEDPDEEVTPDTTPDDEGDNNNPPPDDNEEPDDTDDTTTVPPETQPDEISVKISGQSNPIVGDPVTFRAVVTGAEADAITWSFSPDNTTGFGEGQEITTEFSVAGPVSISVTACSADGECDTSRSRLNVVAAEPDIPLDAKINRISSATVGEPVTFRDVSTGEPETREWFFQDGSPRTSSDTNPTVTFDSPGVKTVSLAVERGDESDQTEVTIQVTERPPPVNLAISCGQTQADVDTTFTCSINAEALDAADNLSFSVSGEGTKTDESLANGRVTVRATGEGTITVTAIASINGETQRDSDTVQGVDQAPEPPNASITGARSVDIDESVTLRVNNSGGPIDGYSWSATGASPSTGSSATFSPSWSTAGPKTVRLTVTQDGESYDAGSVTIEVSDVAPPPEERINDRRLTSDNDNWPRRSIGMFGGARAELESVAAGSADGFNANDISFAYSRNGDPNEAYHEFTFIEYDANGTTLGRTRFRFFVSAKDGAGPNCPAVVFEFTGGPSASTNNALKRANVSWSTSQAGISSYWVTSANGQETPVRTDSGNPQSNGSVVIGQSIYTGSFVPASDVLYTTHVRVESACDGTTIERSVSWRVIYEDDGGGDPDPVNIVPVTVQSCEYRDFAWNNGVLTYREYWQWVDNSEGEVGHRLIAGGGNQEAAGGQQQTFVSLSGPQSNGVTQILTLAPVGSSDASTGPISCSGAGGNWNPPADPGNGDPDTDNDGVPDSSDACPGTPAGTPVDTTGCPTTTDTDNDGVNDDVDACPGTPAGTPVDTTGCPTTTDSDGDGVPDGSDACPGTPAGTPVDGSGCPLPPTDPDSDSDGVPDGSDACPGTPAGTPVDTTGCPTDPDTDGDGVPDSSDDCPTEPGNPDLDFDGCTDPLDPPADGDGDGVPDPSDACPGTPAGTPVDASGCPLPPPPPADSDGDGIPDDNDACPNEPGPVGNDGCPGQPAEPDAGAGGGDAADEGALGNEDDGV